jgi:hypothetical protein
MDIQDWLLSTLLSSAVSVFLVAVLAWLFKNLIKHRLKASVQHEFDEKLETLRADLSKSEESFKADLRAKETEIDAIRSGALSGLASRQSLLDKRRLDAIEQLWASIGVLAPMKLAAMSMSCIKFDVSLKLASEDPQIRDLFAKLPGNVDLRTFPQVEVHKSRPFVSEIAWALFCSYQAIVGYAAAQLQMLKVGLNIPDLLNREHVSRLAKAALPHYADYIDKVGPAGYYNMLEPLEAELLKELQRMMRGEESDKASVKQAAQIMNEVKIFHEATRNNGPGPLSSSISQ